MQVYWGRIEATADLMSELYENLFVEYAWATGEEIMEFSAIIHLDQN